MTSVGESEYLLNGIPGGLSQGCWAHVSRYTHTWVKSRPAGTHRHAQAVTWGPPLGEPRLETRGLQLPGSGWGASGPAGRWVQALASGQGAHRGGNTAVGKRGPLQLTGARVPCNPRGPSPGCTLVLLWSFSGCKGRVEHGAWSHSGGEEAPAGQGGRRDWLQVQIPALQPSDLGEESA